MGQITTDMVTRILFLIILGKASKKLGISIIPCSSVDKQLGQTMAGHVSILLSVYFNKSDANVKINVCIMLLSVVLPVLLT